MTSFYWSWSYKNTVQEAKGPGFTGSDWTKVGFSFGHAIHDLGPFRRPGKPGRLEVPKYFLAILEPNQYQADSHVMPRASEGD